MSWRNRQYRCSPLPHSTEPVAYLAQASHPRGLTATAVEEDIVPASEYRALQNQVKELQRLLGKKTMEGEILKEALEIAVGPTHHLLRSL